jgi:hypothetical protein
MSLSAFHVSRSMRFQLIASVLWLSCALPWCAAPASAEVAPCEASPGAGAGKAASAADSRKKGDEDDFAPGSYAVTNSEKLFVRFHAYPELSGEYRLNIDNTISIPVIGRLNVEGINAACLEVMLARRTSEIARRDVFVTVETVSYRPIYITGAVARPGPVQWSPGMTVLQAMTIAGGRFRSTDALSSR